MSEYYNQNAAQAESQAMQDFYDSDPLGATAAMVATGVQTALAGQAQMINYSNGAVMASQASLVGAAAEDELRAKYADWDEQKPYTQSVLEQNPHLIPQDNMVLDVNTVRNSLELAYRSGREDAADAAADRRWSEIKGAPGGRLDFD